MEAPPSAIGKRGTVLKGSLMEFKSLNDVIDRRGTARGGAY